MSRETKPSADTAAMAQSSGELIDDPLEQGGVALVQDPHSLEEIAIHGGLLQAQLGLVQRLIAKREGIVVHGHEESCLHHLKGVQRLLWIHVHRPTGRGLVGTDGHQRDIDPGAATNFGEAIKHGAVAAVEEGALVVLDQVPAELAMGIVNHPRPPMAGRCHGDRQVFEFAGLPGVQLHDLPKATALHDGADTFWNDDWLPMGQPTQAWQVQMVKVRVSHKD